MTVSAEVGSLLADPLISRTAGEFAGLVGPEKC